MKSYKIGKYSFYSYSNSCSHGKKIDQTCEEEEDMEGMGTSKIKLVRWS